MSFSGKELPSYMQRFPQISQHGASWCIPACLENMLKYIGITTVTQEDLVDLYCKKFPNDGLLFSSNGSYYSVYVLAIKDRRELLDVASRAILKRANFDVFKFIIESAGYLKNSGYRVEYDGTVLDQMKYLDRIKVSVDAGFAPMVAVVGPDGSIKAKTVMAYSQDQLRLFDPDPMKMLKDVPLAQLKFTHDILILRR